MRRRTLLIGGGVALAATGAGLWWQRRHLLLEPAREVGSLADDWPADARADRIELHKAERRLALLSGGETLLACPIALGFAPLGHKQQEGDGRTPEGRYAIDFKNDRSRFFLSIRIDYPNAADRARAKAAGVPPGGDIMIHGQPNWLDTGPDAVLPGDWTLGCAAVSNGAMARIFQAVPLGCAVEIFA